MFKFKKNAESNISKIGFLIVIAAFIIGAGWSTTFSSIKDSAAKISSIRADFTQTKNMKILAKPLISKGFFAYNNQGSIRWEYLSPIENLLIVDSGKLGRFIKRDGKYIADSGAKIEGVKIVVQEIRNWVEGKFEENPMFTAKLVNGDQGKIELLPKDKSISKFISKIILQLSETPGVIKSITIEEGKNSSTLIEFSNVKINAKISDSLFKLPK